MLNFLSRCSVSNWWVVFGSWMQMRSSTKKVSKSLLKVDSIILNNLKERLPGKWKILSELWLRGACIYCECTNSWQEITQKRISGDSWASCSSVLTTWLLNELQTVFQVGGLFWLLRMMFYVFYVLWSLNFLQYFFQQKAWFSCASKKCSVYLVFLQLHML